MRAEGLSMNSRRATRVGSVAYSHTMASDRTRFVDGFRQVAHLGGFHCVIDSDRLVAFPIDLIETVEEAWAAMEPHLRGWELRSALLMNRPFRFERAGHEVRDEQGGQIVGVGVVEEVEIATEVIDILTVRRIDIPEGPPLMEGEESQRLSDRWQQVVHGEERLLVGSYWVLTEVERYLGGRKNAAKELRISSKALNRLGALCDRNDPDHGRKAKGAPDPLEQLESAWIKVFVPRLILRVAEFDSEVEGLSQITMADLPALLSKLCQPPDRWSLDHRCE